jgi:hypothetical protein
VTDPNLTAGQPASVRVSIDGRSAATEQAAGGSSTGTEDSYDLVVPATPGRHTVTVTFVHTGGGQDVTAGSWPVTVIKSAAQGRNHSMTIMVSTTALALPLPTGLLLFRRRRGHRSRHSVSTS